MLYVMKQTVLFKIKLVFFFNINEGIGFIKKCEGNE